MKKERPKQNKTYEMIWPIWKHLYLKKQLSTGSSNGNERELIQCLKSYDPKWKNTELDIWVLPLTSYVPLSHLLNFPRTLLHPMQSENDSHFFILAVKPNLVSGEVMKY